MGLLVALFSPVLSTFHFILCLLTLTNPATYPPRRVWRTEETFTLPPRAAVPVQLGYPSRFQSWARIDPWIEINATTLRFDIETVTVHQMLCPEVPRAFFIPPVQGLIRLDEALFAFMEWKSRARGLISGTRPVDPRHFHVRPDCLVLQNMGYNEAQNVTVAVGGTAYKLGMTGEGVAFIWILFCFFLLTVTSSPLHIRVQVVPPVPAPPPPPPPKLMLG